MRCDLASKALLLTTRTDALTNSHSYVYDATGNLTARTDRNRNVINYSYDALNRPIQVQYNIAKGHGTQLQSTVTYTWDAGNRVATA
jgi:YD repeat-containing protein